MKTDVISEKDKARASKALSEMMSGIKGIKGVSNNDTLDMLVKSLGLPKGSLRFLTVHPSNLIGDLSYQRNPKERIQTLRKIAEEFDPLRLGILHVRARPSGEIVVLDGLGRTYVMTQLLDPAYKHNVLCVDHLHIKDVSQEADWFDKLNPDTVRRVNAKNKFKASVVAGDMEATAIKSAGDRGGLAVGGTGKVSISIQAATTIHAIRCLPLVGAIKHKAWPNLKPTNPMYVAIAAVLYSCPGVKSKRLIDVLMANPPKLIVSGVKEKYGWPHSRDVACSMARYMVGLYNKGLSKNLIKPDWECINEAWQEQPHHDRWGGIAI